MTLQCQYFHIAFSYSVPQERLIKNEEIDRRKTRILIDKQLPSLRKCKKGTIMKMRTKNVKNHPYARRRYK